MRSVLAVLVALAATAAAQDSDHDGLPDFHERHKYFTDPRSADSDGDGIPDGDWNERREYAYTVRTVVQVLRPAAAITDDYQDARVLDETDGYVELEVIHYPLNTVAEAIEGNAEWRKGDRYLDRYLASTRTANWDEEMRTQLLKELRADGIDTTKLDDKQVVEQVSSWLMKRGRYIKGFTVFFVHFPKGRPAILPGLEEAVERNRMNGLSLEEQWQRELFAKGMFENRTHGSCTSSSIYLTGGLRAAGIPTRIILTIPVVDTSDPDELKMLKRLRHHGARRTILGALERSKGSWSSHTYNEVYVGGRWRRLNYQHLGQNILDKRYFGLMTHILTVRDWADVNAAGTIGRRQGTSKRNDAFDHANPYSTITVSDRFGEHARIDNPPPPEHESLTIVELIWYHSDRRPKTVSMKLRGSGGHLLFQVKENFPDEGLQQYRPLYERAGKDLVLKADGHPDVSARAERGYWGSGWFYARIDAAELGKMAVKVPYRLHVVDEKAWSAGENVTLVLEKRAAAAQPAGEFRSLTIDDLVWTDAPEAPRGVGRMKRLALLARVVEWDGWEKMKRFTATADSHFVLEAKGAPPIQLDCGVGGVTAGDQRWIIMMLGDQQRRALVRGVEYRLRPLNGNPPYQWVIREDVTIKRP